MRKKETQRGECVVAVRGEDGEELLCFCVRSLLEKDNVCVA